LTAPREFLWKPSKINQNAVLFFVGFKLNKAKGFELVSLIFEQIAIDEFKNDKCGVIFRTAHAGGMQKQRQNGNYAY
jgi:hypothetical protein